MRLTVIESPYAGDVDANITYARRALADSLARGEAPIASHLLYTQPGVLDDTVPAERTLGIEAGLAWGDKADVTALYVGRGISSGMLYGIQRAITIGRPIEVRSLPDDPDFTLHEQADTAVICVADAIVVVDRDGDGAQMLDAIDSSVTAHVVTSTAVLTKEP